ncbi:phospholipase A and acyltransferase 4 [Salmo salar]|uniref:Phospholipase A and acyltransferase 4 n=1 Tax=Salmo salar TaxID=8030 RepID=A0ABM3CUW4_SALSA|nr:phospholipase A and acyltransferase 4-like [Salmo salar]
MRMKQTFIFVILLTIYIQLGTSNETDEIRIRKPPPQGAQAAQGNAAGTFTFGDIITFPRTTLGISSYNHYAIYVGDKNIRGKVSGQDIFHFSGEITDLGNANCVFAKLEDVTENSTPEVQNRDTADLKMRKVEDMIQDITTLHNRCKGLYGPISDNCEHLATVIRYGSATCKQEGANKFIQFLAVNYCSKEPTPLSLKKNNKRGRGRRGLLLLHDETRANQGAPAA